MKDNKEKTPVTSLTQLKASQITETHKDSQNKLREILMKKRAAERTASNEDGFSI